WLRRQFSLLGHEAEADALAMHLLARSQGVATLASAFHDDKFIRQEVSAMCDWLNSYAGSGRRNLGDRDGGRVKRQLERTGCLSYCSDSPETKARPVSSWKATRRGSSAASMTASSCWSAAFNPIPAAGSLRTTPRCRSCKAG